MTFPALISKNTANMANIIGIDMVWPTIATRTMAMTAIITFPGLKISMYGFIIFPQIKLSYLIEIFIFVFLNNNYIKYIT